MTDPVNDQHPDLVLIVGENPITREVLSRWLSADGWMVIATDSGPKALTQAAERRPGVMLVDLDHPEAEGDETFARLRQIPAYAPRLLALLSHAPPARRHALRQVGILGVFVKPIDLKSVSAFLGAPDGQESCR
ncbi:hypothetical protein CKO38_03935 [Rhodospirillum rubrum]|uniref:response regulator n=1 Tax=Rhodospirillum rubrum TaxID=1085 RepID=UPI001902E70C|nr:response regulator [Rhodospirillum rubrum]MBK1663825.1 hypothetical protein [Rhodospirillum rubrum]MBK1675836.1 hypothetical protein [Rhodospirillum rubrum]